MKNKKINKMKEIGMLYLIFTILIIFPMQIGQVYGVEPKKVPGGTHTVETGNSLCGGSAGTDVKSSLILSIVLLCLPGILEKVWQWNQIQCQEIQCHYNAILNDLDPTYCTKSEAYQVCTLVIGEMFAIPPLAILEYFRKIISELLANPVGLVYAGGVLVAKHYLSTVCIAGGPGSIFCKAPFISGFVFIVVVADLTAIAQRFKDMMEYGFFPPGQSDSENYCDGISDIVEEMQLIVDETNGGY